MPRVRVFDAGERANRIDRSSSNAAIGKRLALSDSRRLLPEELRAEVDVIVTRDERRRDARKRVGAFVDTAQVAEKNRDLLVSDLESRSEEGMTAWQCWCDDDADFVHKGAATTAEIPERDRAAHLPALGAVPDAVG